jgi:hypothetical protein
MDDAEKSYLEKLEYHWRSSADRLWVMSEEADADDDECLRECDQTAAIVLRDCADALNRFKQGLPILIGLTPEDKLLQALKEREPNA